MTKIIDLQGKARRARLALQDDPARENERDSAEIFFFTGVRYERMAPCDARSTDVNSTRVTPGLTSGLTEESTSAETELSV